MRDRASFTIRALENWPKITCKSSTAITLEDYDWLY